MRYQTKGDEKYSIDENLRMEAEAHDEDYDGRMPFGLDSMEFTKEQVWAVNDQAYKKGCYRRGQRKRRLFEIMELEEIAGKRVLEVGCGQGHNAVFFAMYGARVSGFDLSPKGIEMAKRIAKANNVGDLCDFQVANVSELPYESGSFDVVVCNAVLHHVVKYPGVREELYRVLRSGGRLFFAEGVRDNVLYRYARTLRRKIKPVHYHGDIDLEMADIHELTKGYSAVEIEQFALFEKFAQGFGRDYDNSLPVRALYAAANVVDRVLLTVIPPLRKQCLEIVGVATK